MTSRPSAPSAIPMGAAATVGNQSGWRSRPPAEQHGHVDAQYRVDRAERRVHPAEDPSRITTAGSPAATSVHSAASIHRAISRPFPPTAARHEKRIRSDESVAAKVMMIHPMS